MAIKDKLLTYGLIGLALVALAKPLAGLAGQVGGSVGSAFSQGLQDFANALSGGLIPAAGSQNQMTSNNQNMISTMMMPNAAAMTASNAAAADAAITAGSSAAEAAALMKALMSGKSFEDSLPSGGLTGGTSQTNSLIDMLTRAISGSTKDVTFTTQGLNDIFKGAYDYLAKGASDIEGFLRTYKFPSGESLQDVLGGVGKGSLTPEAFGAVQEIAAMPMNNLVNINTSLPTPAMMAAMNLNIDRKIGVTDYIAPVPDMKVDTPYGVIGIGGNPNSIGLGKGTILPAQNLTQVLQQHPEFTASEAADYLYRIMTGPNQPTQAMSNTGAGLISQYDPTGKMVISSMINPVLLAYEQYRAQYGF